VLNVANGSHVDAMSHIVGCARDGDIYLRSRAIVTVLKIATSSVPVRFDQLSLGYGLTHVRRLIPASLTSVVYVRGSVALLVRLPRWALSMSRLNNSTKAIGAHGRSV
jgi:hypothetical protein